jgi:hypothetical protein
MHTGALQEFSGEVRRSLEHMVGETLPDRCWHVAQLSIAGGGFGVRDAERQAPAAYMASAMQSRSLCQRIDPGFDPLHQGGELVLLRPAQSLNDSVLEAARIDFRSRAAVSQKKLSSVLDAAAAEALWRAPGRGRPGHRWRPLPVGLKRRLRVQVPETDTFCPSCDICTGRFGDHALVCQCGGDRTVRHNAIRKCFGADASDAGLKPEKKKAGLLPTSPCEDVLPASSGSRRSAHSWLPRGEDGRGRARDFACTSSMRADLVERSE